MTFGNVLAINLYCIYCDSANAHVQLPAYKPGHSAVPVNSQLDCYVFLFYAGHAPGSWRANAQRPKRLDQIKPV